MRRRRSGFTLVGLTVALGLMVVVAGVVVVRVDGWSSRQTLRSAARRLGNTIRHYREEAQLHESIYAVRFDLEEGTYEVLAVLERSALGKPKTLRSVKLREGQSFGKIMIGELEMPTPFTMALGPRGILPETTIEIKNAASEKVTLTLGALVNEVAYEEDEPEE